MDYREDTDATHIETLQVLDRAITFDPRDRQILDEING